MVSYFLASRERFINPWGVTDLLTITAPRHRNLWATLPGADTSHPCFPWKVWVNLQVVASTIDNAEGLCIASCPRQSQV